MSWRVSDTGSVNTCFGRYFPHGKWTQFHAYLGKGYSRHEWRLLKVLEGCICGLIQDIVSAYTWVRLRITANKKRNSQDLKFDPPLSFNELNNTCVVHGGFSALKMDDVPPKRWYLPTSAHGVTTQETTMDIFTTVRTSNLIKICVHVGLPTTPSTN
jgi:hypothetical protein